MEYSNDSNIFLAENAAKFLENTRINKHVIELKKSKQPLFRFIYSLEPVELKTLKTYIKTNLAISVIWPFKFSARALILFERKSDRSLCYYVDY